MLGSMQPEIVAEVEELQVTAIANRRSLRRQRRLSSNGGPASVGLSDA
jgi:hypothetical protein